MNIIDKESIFPILIPTDLYIDRYGNYNGFVEMNPSMYILDDGSFIILIRTVDCLKYKDGTFTIYGNKSVTDSTFISTSLYSIIRGKIDKDKFNLDNYEIDKLIIKYNIEQTPSAWCGIEDIRFVNNNTILACIPEVNNGWPCICEGVLTDNILSINVKCNPYLSEKNWMPYITSAEKSKVIYSISPFVIKSIMEDDREEIILSYQASNELKGWRGSSNSIDLFGGNLFLIHKKEDRFYNRWLLFNQKTKQILYSKPFVFFRDTYIEFVCSLSIYKDKIYIGLGVNDNKAYIIQINKDEIMKLFVYHK